MRVLIAAGGTAGHINPALAIAGAIKKTCLLYTSDAADEL
mgnify:CR=1 FL=1